MSAGAKSFAFVEVIPGLKDLVHAGLEPVANSILVLAVIVPLLILSTRRAVCTEDGAIPDEKFTLRNFGELIMQGIMHVMGEGLGHDAPKYVYFLGTCMVFILFSNLSGLVPGFLPPTDNINITASCGITIFLLYNFYGFKTNGAGYLKHFMGPFLALSPLMIPIELIGHCVRPISLSLRLFGNIFGDHQLTGQIIGLAPLIAPVPVMVLGLFVCFVQTFVFSLLSMAYIAGATEEGHH